MFSEAAKYMEKNLPSSMYSARDYPIPGAKCGSYMYIEVQLPKLLLQPPSHSSPAGLGSRPNRHSWGKKWSEQFVLCNWTCWKRKPGVDLSFLHHFHKNYVTERFLIQVCSLDAHMHIIKDTCLWTSIIDIPTPSLLNFLSANWL